MIKKFLIAMVAAFSTVASAAERPNILFILADDASVWHFGAYGCKTIRTPSVDRLAREGALFRNAFSAAPTCTASRGTILTGQYMWRLGAGANLWSYWPNTEPIYTDLLEKAGYKIGLFGKGWAPGDFKRHGRTTNPAGPDYRSFAEFLGGLKPDEPFCFWFGSRHPHRPYEKGSGLRAGHRLDEIEVPPFLPDTPEVRSDLLDYMYAIELFDKEIAGCLAALKTAGRESNTLVVVSSDNGMPFPHSKANLYDESSREPLVFCWPGHIQPGSTFNDLVGLPDLAPTFLEAAGLKAPAVMTAQSLLPLLEGKMSSLGRSACFFGRERHANARAGNVGYPSRAIRTEKFLYIRNFASDRWPAGDPPGFEDIDGFGSASKIAVIATRNTGNHFFFDLSAAKRLADELYDIEKDPWQTNNLVGDPAFAGTRAKLAAQLQVELKNTSDPRVGGGGDAFDKYDFSKAKAVP